MRSLLATLAVLASVAPAPAQPPLPAPREGDFIIKNFAFASGEMLPELKLHYLTLGTEKRNAAGEIVNAVLLLHGTSGTGRSWLEPSPGGELFAAGGPLDLANHYIVMPDGIGRGGSSKPSDGLRMKFPHYRYADMVSATHRLLTEHLGLKRLRLVMGASMGGMHAWMWGEMFPGYMDGVVPVASMPIAISGRNWLYRRMQIEAIRNDPDWKGGNYEKNPTHFALTSPAASMMTDSAVHLQTIAPSSEAMDAIYKTMVANAAKRDANDTLYATEAILGYDPSKDLEQIKAKVLAINFADDEVNPAELGVVEREMKRIPGSRFVLIPATETTRGHLTYNDAATWKQHLAEFMKELPPTQ